jgi:hypothetical protein
MVITLCITVSRDCTSECGLAYYTMPNIGSYFSAMAPQMDISLHLGEG